MAGHSKWANIKHRKGRADAKKGKIFSKIAKEIMVAARTGGGDLSANITLRALVQKARTYNMPADNIDRAVKKGSGELEAETLEELTYEGYAGGGVAVIVETLTDNRNRTAGDVKALFNKYNASMAGPGSVSRTFQRKGLILVKAENATEDQLLEIVLEAGAEDLSAQDDAFEIVTDPSTFMDVVEALNAAGIEMENSELSLLPETYLPVTDAGQAGSIMRFTEALEDLDDVQNVYTNADIDASLMESLSA